MLISQSCRYKIDGMLEEEQSGDDTTTLPSITDTTRHKAKGKASLSTGKDTQVSPEPCTFAHCSL